MRIKGIVDEDFVNYKLPSMYIIFPFCNLKCDKENGENYCQNSSLLREPIHEILEVEIAERYIKNPITKAIVFGGLEPFDSALEMLFFVKALRETYHCNDKVVIYTGYTEEEIEEGKWGSLSPDTQKEYWEALKSLGNIVVKFGRFRPNQEGHYDSVLGVKLASENQYAKEYNCGLYESVRGVKWEALEQKMG